MTMQALPKEELENAANPGLLRRVAAMFYDSWLLVALWLVGATLSVGVHQLLGVTGEPSRLPLQLYLIACQFVFFGWFWTHGGQTLGMRAWRLKLLDTAGRTPTWRQAIVRVAVAHLSLFAFGLGYLWMLIDRNGQTWHDRVSDTRLFLTRDE